MNLLVSASFPNVQVQATACQHMCMPFLNAITLQDIHPRPMYSFRHLPVQFLLKQPAFHQKPHRRVLLILPFSSRFVQVQPELPLACNTLVLLQVLELITSYKETLDESL